MPDKCDADWKDVNRRILTTLISEEEFDTERLIQIAQMMIVPNLDRFFGALCGADIERIDGEALARILEGCARPEINLHDIGRETGQTKSADRPHTDRPPTGAGGRKRHIGRGGRGHWLRASAASATATADADTGLAILRVRTGCRVRKGCFASPQTTPTSEAECSGRVDPRPGNNQVGADGGKPAWTGRRWRGSCRSDHPQAGTAKSAIKRTRVTGDHKSNGGTKAGPASQSGSARKPRFTVREDN